MNLKMNKVNYFTCALCFLLIIVILLSQKTINNDMLFYFLIIVSLLIIISCLLDLSGKNYEYITKIFETFNNMNLENKKICYERNKEYLDYKEKINIRLKNFIKLEESNRKNEKYEDEDRKIVELNKMNDEYLVNGESF